MRRLRVILIFNCREERESLIDKKDWQQTRDIKKHKKTVRKTKKKKKGIARVCCLEKKHKQTYLKQHTHDT